MQINRTLQAMFTVLCNVSCISFLHIPKESSVNLLIIFTVSCRYGCLQMATNCQEFFEYFVGTLMSFVYKHLIRGFLRVLEVEIEEGVCWDILPDVNQGPYNISQYPM